MANDVVGSARNNSIIPVSVKLNISDEVPERTKKICNVPKRTI